MTKAVNDMEIRILGLMRSGNHAIISWLHSLHPDRSICFLNNIRHGDYDPFENYAQKELTGLNEAMDTGALKNIDKDVLIYSYEDRDSLKTENIDFLSSVFNHDFEGKREDYLGKSNHRLDVIIIRDPFNCLASRLVLMRKRGALGGLDDMDRIKNNWKIVARKVIDMEKQAAPHQVVINYNRWLLDRTYQEQTASALLAPTVTKRPDYIPSYVGGSSFQDSEPPLSHRDFINHWQRIFSIKRWLHLHKYLRRLCFLKKTLKTRDLLSRWQSLSNDEEYQKLFVDRELLELSEQIFGEIPGTHEFVDEVCRNSSSAA